MIRSSIAHFLNFLLGLKQILIMREYSIVLVVFVTHIISMGRHTKHEGTHFLDKHRYSLIKRSLVLFMTAILESIINPDF